MATIGLFAACAGNPEQGGSGTADGTGTTGGTVSEVSSNSISVSVSASASTAEATTSPLSGTDESTGTSDAFCGDAVTEGSEECDLGSANGEGDFCKDDCTLNSCPDGYLGPGELCDDGDLVDTNECNNDCTLNSCGDGDPDDGEQCDDGNMSNVDDCLNTCVIASCGDSFIHEVDEVCDNRNVGDQTCVTQGFDGGSLFCNGNCETFDTASCFECGDGSIDDGEDCDGAVLGGVGCEDFAGMYDDGTLACDGSCNYDFTDCTLCGDEMAEAREDCDGNDIPGSCALEGFAGGALGCNSDCSYNTSQCHNCGDNFVDPGEQCDMSAGVGPCSAEDGMYGCGDTTCDSNCMLVFTACLLDSGEMCNDQGECCSDNCNDSHCCANNGESCLGDGDCCNDDCNDLGVCA